MLALPAESVLVVCHELPIRYALNTAAGSDELDHPFHEIPNATPYLFDGPCWRPRSTGSSCSRTEYASHDAGVAQW